MPKHEEKKIYLNYSKIKVFKELKFSAHKYEIKNKISFVFI